MTITDPARDFLLQLLSDKNANGIRVYYAGMGWGGPQIDVSLEEPQSDDIKKQINGIQVAFDPRIESFVEDRSLDFQKTFYGEGLVLTGGAAC